MMTVAKAAHEKGNPFEYDGYDWKKLSVDDWLDLLIVHPEFSEKCTANIWRQFNELDIRELLCKHPQFADKCNLSLLTPYFWVDILCEQPQLSDKCDWRYWEGSDWATLLRWQPQFAERCEWDKLDGCDWVRILEKQPQFFDRVSMEKLGDIESELWSDQARRRFDALWDNLMTAQPHFSIYRKPNQTYPQMTEEEILSGVLDMH